MKLASLFLCGLGGWILGTSDSVGGLFAGAVLWYLAGITVVLGLPSKVLSEWIRISDKKVTITIEGKEEN